METKRQQQKTLTTKKFDLDLNAFLHSVICFPIKDNNKHFIFNLGNTNNVMFSLTNFWILTQSITTISHVFSLV
jgi:hypothetical protein